MTALTYTFYIIAAIVGFYLIFPFLTVAASLFFKGKTSENASSSDQILVNEPKSRFLSEKGQNVQNFDFANIITAYRNADIARPLVESLINQAHSAHHIYLVADNADVSNWQIQHDKLTVLKPDSALNLKVKSIIYATERFIRKHDFTIIWDADNLAHPNFLTEMNRLANTGAKAIQGQRTAKNLDNKIAAADSLGEFYKNFIERLVPPRLGSSTVISGSGMAVEQNLYASYLYGKDIQTGQHLWKKMMQEDKILQNHILRTNERIIYAPNAVCFDEKVTSADAVETQRSRWLFSYFQNLPNSTGFILRGIVGCNWNKFFFGLVTAAPPLFILVGLSGLLIALGLFINWKISATLIIAELIFVANIFWTLKLSDAPRSVYDSVLAMPVFVFRQFLALFKMVNPNKNFKHSEHKVAVSVDDVLK